MGTEFSQIMPLYLLRCIWNFEFGMVSYNNAFLQGRTILALPGYTLLGQDPHACVCLCP